MERIRRIAAHHIEVPLDTPIWAGGYAIRQRDYCLLELTTDAGRTGSAIGFARGGDLAGAVSRQLAPLLVNQHPEQIERLWKTMYESTRLTGRQGLLMRALSLADLALWDLKAAKAGLPLFELLGGCNARVPVLMAGGYYAPDKGTEELIAEYEAYVASGFTSLKLMVGGASMEEDLRRFIAVRRSLPPGVSLAVDANGAWDDRKAVLRWIERAGELGGEISFVEEPLPPDDIAGLAWIRNRAPVAIASGEFSAGRWTFLSLMEQGCMDIVRADATLCGGITEWKRIAALASAYNLPLIPHYFASVHFHLAMAFPECSMIEVVSPQGKTSSVDLLMGRTYLLQDGYAHPKRNADAGFGFEPDRELIAAHTVYSTAYS